MSEDKPKQNTRTTTTPDEQITLPAGFSIGSIGTVKGRHCDGDKIVIQPAGKK